ncbi:MAG: dUTP diphosphatase [Kiritimatiellaeota bacterium]|nr:dUTP diphosphatase [Kiritimatiellota bacterium]
MKLHVARVHPDAQLPCYAHPGDAGMDLCVCERAVLAPMSRALVSTGLRIALPPGTEAQIRPRSGNAFKHGITVLNSPGTIDEGYRGELKILLVNLGGEAFTIEPGMRVAQMVVAPVLRVAVEETADLDATTRGAGGFGSTGV